MVRVRIPALGGAGRPTEDVIGYYESVTRGSPAPVVVIHQPRGSLAPDATPEQVGEITAMDNVYAYIISLNLRWECRVPKFIAPGVKLWTCNGSITLPGAMLGATGGCMFFANWAPRLVKQILQLAMDGQFAEALEIQKKMYHADYLGMSWGVATLKSGLNMLGFEATLPRRPTLPLPPEREAQLREAFVECGLLDT